jgi:glycosyltransferase involved in cell wall biosynthesis
MSVELLRQREIVSPLFSVITICLNPGGKLEDTVNSVLTQSFSDFEFIIKDGGSSDGSIQALPGDSRIQRITSSDMGIYDAMNGALARASGAYILFLNAGDTFFGNDVLKQVALKIERSDYPSLLYTDYTTKEDPSQTYVQPHQLSGFTLFCNTLNHQTCYFDRRFYDQLGVFDAAYRIWGDYDFLLRFWKRKPVSTVHLPIVGTVYEGGGISTKRDNLDIGLRELRKARRKNFSESERAYYGALRCCTIPTIRSWMVSSHSPMAVKRMYITVRNILYKAAMLLHGGGAS